MGAAFVDYRKENSILKTSYFILKNIPQYSNKLLIKQNMKQPILLALFFFIFGCAHAQKVFKTSHKSEADKIIYVTEHKSEADMIVFETKYKSESKPFSGIWFWTEHKSEADWKVYFTKYKSEATLKIYITKYKSEAGMK